jgi:hypothetical protein
MQCLLESFYCICTRVLRLVLVLFGFAKFLTTELIVLHVNVLVLSITEFALDQLQWSVWLILVGWEVGITVALLGI